MVVIGKLLFLRKNGVYRGKCRREIIVAQCFEVRANKCFGGWQVK